jgi:hypothetical protein
LWRVQSSRSARFFGSARRSRGILSQVRDDSSQRMKSARLMRALGDLDTCQG